MKRIKSILLISILLMSISITKVYATEDLPDEDISIFDNGKDDKIQNDTDLSYLKTPFLLLIGAGFIILVAGTLNKEDKNKVPKTKEVDLEVLDKEIDQIELKEKIFKLYKDVQSARTKNRIKLLEPLVTENLYKKYEKEINTLKENKQKMVITDILSKELKILSIENKENEKYINVFLHVIQYDYAIDKDKKIIKGTGDAKYQVELKLKVLYDTKELKLDKMECTGKWISK